MDSLEIEAVYQGGVLKLLGPVPLSEGQKVKVTIHVPPPAPMSPGFPRGYSGDREDLQADIDAERNNPFFDED